MIRVRKGLFLVSFLFLADNFFGNSGKFGRLSKYFFGRLSKFAD